MVRLNSAFNVSVFLPALKIISHFRAALFTLQVHSATSLCNTFCNCSLEFSCAIAPRNLQLHLAIALFNCFFHQVTSNLVIPLSQAVHVLFEIELCNALQQVHLSTPHRSYRVRSIAQLHLANPSELAACGEALQSHFANDICNWTLQLTIANGLCKCPLGPHYRTPLYVTFTMEFCNVSLQIHLLCSNTLIHLLKFLHCDSFS